MPKGVSIISPDKQEDLANKMKLATIVPYACLNCYGQWFLVVWEITCSQVPQYYFNETPQIKLYVVENQVR